MPKNYVEHPDGTIEILVMGHPFYGPDYLNGRDLHGEYFHPGTDFGPLEKVQVWWDHNKGMKDKDFKNFPDFADEPIGVAEKRERTDEGELWSIFVDRHYKYKNLIKRAAEEKMLYSSSHPFQRSVRIDPSTKRIDRWHTVEMTLTLAGAHPGAGQQEIERFKSLLAEELGNMPEEKEVVVATPVTPATVEQTETPVVPSEPAATAAADVSATVEPVVVADEKSVEVPTPVSASPATDALKALIKEKTEAVVETAAEVTEEDTPKEKGLEDWLNADVVQIIAQIKSNLEALTATMLTLMANSEKSVEIQEKTLAAAVDNQTALPLMVDAIAQAVSAKVSVEAGKPDAQKAAEKSATEKIISRNGPVQRNPAAPGRDRKAASFSRVS